jgi:hypothetical protein
MKTVHSFLIFYHDLSHELFILKREVVLAVLIDSSVLDDIMSPKVAADD